MTQPEHAPDHLYIRSNHLGQLWNGYGVGEADDVLYLRGTSVRDNAQELLEALDYLLEQTVDQDLKYGIELSEGEEDARQRALAVIAKARP
jgi:hypothetical protein